jgi:hypothetical protein
MFMFQRLVANTRLQFIVFTLENNKLKVKIFAWKN